MSSLTLVILAAGMGSRYGGIKQIEGLGPKGELIIDYSICHASKAGFRKIVLVIRHDIEQYFPPLIAKWEKHFGVEVQCCYQELSSLPAGEIVPTGRAKPWGTAHAILCTRNLVHTPFAVINADDYYGEKTYQVLANFLQSVSAQSNEQAMVAFLLQNTLSPYGPVSRGVCKVNEKGHLQEVTEHTKLSLRDGKVYSQNSSLLDASPTSLVSMNFWGFTPVLFPFLEEHFGAFLAKEKNSLQSECYIPAAVDAGVKQGKFSVRVLESSEKWLGVTYREDVVWVKQGLPALF